MKSESTLLEWLKVGAAQFVYKFQALSVDLERYERDQCMNPEMQFDVLPQPYRMIVKASC